MFSNRSKLHPAIYKILTYDEYEPQGDISVNTLINPVRQTELILRNQEKILQDASERALMLMGNLVHYSFAHICERLFPNSLVEHRMLHRVQGWDVSGTSDLVYLEELPKKDLFDWKFCSAYEGKGKMKPEKEAQLNCYARLLAEQDIEVTNAYIGAFFRDWSLTKKRSKWEYNYPVVPVKDMKAKLWRYEEQCSYMAMRVMAHQEFSESHECDLPECTPDECWEKPSHYSVKKVGAKRSSKNCASREEAVSFLDRVLDTKGESEWKKYRIVFVPGDRTRCKDYCIVSKFCEQYRQWEKTNK